MAAEHLVPGRWAATSSGELASRARLWLDEPALRAVLVAFDAPATLNQDIRALADWSARTLDTRHGRERRDALPTRWTDARVEAVIASADALGLGGGQLPELAAYDTVVVLGGMTVGNRLRVELAAGVARHLHIGELVGLTADRALGPTEIADEPSSREDLTEWANLRRNVALRLGPLKSVAKPVWSGRGHALTGSERFHGAGDLPVRLLVAPSPDLRRRASTADALRHLSATTSLVAGRSLLLVTSGVYVPYQFFAAASLLLLAGATRVEILGTRTALARDRQVLAQRLAQETHAAISTAHRVIDATAESDPLARVQSDTEDPL